MGALSTRWTNRQVAALDGVWTGLAPVERPADNRLSDDYRPLTWDDVAALAAAESVTLTRSGNRVQLTLPAQAV